MDAPEDHKFTVQDPQLQNLLDLGPNRLSKAVENFLQGNRRGLSGQSPTFMFYPDLPSQPILDSANFCWAKTLEENWTQIRDECLALANDSTTKVVNIKSSVTETSTWNTIHFINEGELNKENMARCPITTELLSSVPLLRGCCLGYCYVSVILPGTHITPHYGPSNVKYRCHLPLACPYWITRSNTDRVSQYVAQMSLECK